MFPVFHDILSTNCKCALGNTGISNDTCLRLIVGYVIINNFLSFLSSVFLLQVISFFVKDTDNALWASLLDTNIVQYSEDNIIDCFSALKLNESLIPFINKCDIGLDFSKKEYDEDIKRELFYSVIICNSIENPKYEQILVSLKFFYDNFDITEISDDKIVILIDTNIIRMTADNLEFMRENYPSHNFHFICKNIGKYVDIMDDTLFSQEELLEILTWDISDEQKIKLLKLSDEEISIIGKIYSSVVCLHILDNNFAESDLPELFSSFEKWDNSVQEKIFEYAIRDIVNIIDDSKSVSEKLKNNLLYSDKVGRDMKIELLITMMPDLSEGYIKKILALLDLTEYIKIFDTHSRPKFEINDENEKLLTAFKEKGLIHNYEKIPDKEGYYKVVRKKLKK